MVGMGISILVEIVMILLFLSFFYEQKFKLNWITICVIALDLVICGFINIFALSQIWIICIYIAVWGYSVYMFRATIAEHFINVVLAIVGTGMLQASVTVPFLLVLPDIAVDENTAICFNGLALLLLLFLEKKIHLGEQRRRLFKHSNALTKMVIGLCTCVVIFLLVIHRITKRMPTEIFLLIILFGGVMCMLCVQWIKQMEKTTEKELDLKTYDVYYEVFKGMIQELREKQHDYHNHIQAIYNQHFLCESYEELVHVQKEYCGQLEQENIEFDLVNCSNIVVAGFLYGKVMEAARSGCIITHNVQVYSQHLLVSIYVVIEILGILIDNAIEAVSDLEDKQFWLDVVENEESLRIEIKNPTCQLSMNEIMQFFQEGVSSKGPDRGMGLFKVRKYCQKYKWDVVAIPEQVENQHYFKIQVIIKK